jgi:hypothetical protein
MAGRDTSGRPGPSLRLQEQEREHPRTRERGFKRLYMSHGGGTLVRKSRARRRSAAPKYDVVYSQDLVTPHVKWADPYVNGPIRAFFVSSVDEGRVVVELMQRLTLDPRVVSIDPRWDVNRWCMDRYADFDGRDPKDYSKSFAVLEAELKANARYDVLVMHSILGWNHIPKRLRELIEARVRRGEGLVLVHPHLGEDERDKSLWKLSPLTQVESTRLDGPGAGVDEGYPRPPQEAISGHVWRRAADHYVVDGIPFGALPYPALKHYLYKLGKDSQALVTGEGGAPVVAVKQYGKGRVVALGYHNYALFPELAAHRGELREDFWEYLYSLLGRAVVWAARREPGVRLLDISPSAPQFGPGEVQEGRVVVRLANAGRARRAQLAVTMGNEDAETEEQVRRSVRLSRGETEVTLPLPRGPAAGGRHCVEVIVSTDGKRQDWGTAIYQVRRRARVTKVLLESDSVAAGRTLRGRARLTGKARGMTLVSELWDQSGRLLDRSAREVRSGREVRFSVRCLEALTNVGWVKCRLMDGDRYVDEARAEVALTPPRRRWEDYEVNVPWLHGGMRPWTDLIEDQYRKAGVTSTSDPRLNFLLTVSLETPGFGVYWYRRHSYLSRKAQYGRTKDPKYLARVPCIHTDDFRRPVARAIRRGIPAVLKYSPLAYYLADESSITCYEDAFDLCWSDATLAEFRKWLRRQYGSLSKLNAEWGTRYRSWQKVMPATWEEAQKRSNPAPWVDHRLFMNKTLAEGFAYACRQARRADPKGLMTISGTQMPGSHNGCDWWQLDQIIDYLQPYSVGGQDEMHRSFNPGLILTGFTGYALSGAPLEYEIWHRFFHGQRGASIFWGYSFVDPDLTLNAQGRSLAKCFGELRGEGLSRIVNRLRRQHDKIAIHFSMASGHVWWIRDGKLKYDGLEYGRRTSRSFARFVDNRVAWGQILEDLGYQYDYVSYEQVGNGELRGFRALILPASVALSEQEVESIREFVRRGGLVIADVPPGTTDEHGKPQPQGQLDDVFSAPRRGRGRAVCLERWLDGYGDARLTAKGSEIRDAISDVIDHAGIRARTVVAGPSTTHPLGVERANWRADGVEVVGLLKELRAAFRESADGTSGYVVKKGMKTAERVRVRLPKEGHWYDLRDHRYLGVRDEIRTTLREADPKLYAMLPYRVRGLSLSLEGGRSPGDLVRYEAKVKAGRARPVRHVLKLEVLGPDGAKRSLYSRNIETRGGVARSQFRMALNDEPGKWRIMVTDVFSGESAEKSWTVR